MRHALPQDGNTYRVTPYDDRRRVEANLKCLADSEAPAHAKHDPVGNPVVQPYSRQGCWDGWTANWQDNT